MRSFPNSQKLKTKLAVGNSWKYIVFTTLVASLLLRKEKHLNRHTSRTHDFENKKVAIVFYGLPRSLQWTITSIRQQVMAPLERNKFDFEIFLHSYIHEEGYSNKRSNENLTRLNNSEWKLLKPTQYKIEYLREIQKKYEVLFEKLKNYGDSWKDEYESLRRYIIASHSLKQATRLVIDSIFDSNMKYAGMLVIRPDLRYLDEIDINLLSLAMHKKAVVLPSWGWDTSLGGGGFNDRFSYGDISAMILLGNRLDGFLTYCEDTKGSFHSEPFYYWFFILEGYKSVIPSFSRHMSPIEVLCTDQRAVRVRANSVEAKEDFSPVQKFCKPSRIGIMHRMKRKCLQISDSR